jgi:uncharacterized iron-regulated membrane protein
MEKEQTTQKKNTRSLFRRIIVWLHLWLGLISGIVVVIVCITGCIYAFQEDISNVVYKNTFKIQPQKTATLSLSFLQEKAQDSLGKNEPVNFITAYKDSSKAWEFMAYKENDTALTYFGTTEYFRSAFVNPYTGAVTGIRDYKYDFFNIVKYVHWSLLLNTDVGQPIVGWCTLVFVISLITGLILWWPRKWNKTTRRTSFTIKWKARFKRLNYDLHNVLGFYSLLLALVLALSGMVYSFGWFSNFVYAAANVSFAKPVHTNAQSVPVDSIINKPIDIAFNNASSQMPNANRIGVTPATGKEGVIYISGYNRKGVYYDADELQYDQYSGKLLHRKNYAQKNSGEKIIGMNYDIHVGSIGGLAGKIIAFIISLICASLPVTGFLFWLNRKK